MVAKFELQGVGIKIVLPLQVSLVIFPHIMIDQGHGHNEGDKAAMVIIKNFNKFLLFSRGKKFFELPRKMKKHIEVFI